jgi:hypothetical protein
MTKTRMGLLFCLACFALTILIAPPFKHRAQTMESQPLNSTATNLFVTYQNGKGTTTRQLAAEASADYQTSQHKAGQQNLLHEISSRSASAREAIKARGGLFLRLQATPELEKSPQAKAALLRAAAKWESLILDQISVVVNVDFGSTYFGRPFPTPNVTNVTNVQSIFFLQFGLLAFMRQKTLDDRTALILASLPDASLPTELGTSEGVNCPTPIARSVGALSPDADPVGESGRLPALPSIGFNSQVKFDFDPSDGIDPDKLDFEALVQRELGRILGFTSNAGATEVDPAQRSNFSVWDYFRFRPGLKFDEINRTTRALFSGGEHVYFNTGEPLPLSTGKPNGSGGDGNPAGHWKDDALTGRYIGIMDPTLALGERGGITVNDLDALRLMGYVLPIDAPFIEVLSADDNSREESVKLNGTMAVTRLAPAYYPAELQSIRLQLPPPSDGESLAGTQLRVVAFVDAARSGRPAANPQYLVDRTITIQSLPENRMLEVVIPNAPVINSGDLYIGAQSASSKLAIGADGGSADGGSADGGSERQHSFLSTDNGASFQPLQAGGNSPLNLIARAVVGGRIENYATAAATSLSPASVLAGTRDFILTVSGRNFSFGDPATGILDSLVRWNGQAREAGHCKSTFQPGTLRRRVRRASRFSPKRPLATWNQPRSKSGSRRKILHRRSRVYFLTKPRLAARDLN